jgi:hypothetical protein
MQHILAHLRRKPVRIRCVGVGIGHDVAPTMNLLTPM